MKSLLFVLDPIGDGYSVQFEVIKSFSKILKERYNVYVYSSYFPEKKARLLEEMGIVTIMPNGKFLINSILNIFGKKNESMLWVESWFREAYMNKNSREIKKLKNFDIVVNLSTTIPIKSDVWWIQGRSFYFTLLDMKRSSRLVRIGLYLLGNSVKRRDEKLLELLKNNSKKIITNAMHLANFYSSMGYKISDTIYTSKDFSMFKPLGIGKGDFVLTYIGKETDIATIIKIAEKGVKIKGFGSKVPMGISLSEIKKKIDYLGYVSDEELIRLYNEARFTAFPFTEEPFGYVPIESMACGTPVLSYNKQGPAETIIDGKTGWLVSSSDEFIMKALEIWEKGHNINPNNCIERAKEFTTETSAMKLIKIIED